MGLLGCLEADVVDRVDVMKAARPTVEALTASQSASVVISRSWMAGGVALMWRGYASADVVSELIPPGRRAALVLCGPGGAVLGRLPEVAVETPWWQDVEPVVAAVRDEFGIDVVVLRMLDSELARPHGGLVTYLAEVADRLPPDAAEALEPWDGELDEQPLRLPYARPGGPTADLASAEGVHCRSRR